LGASEEAVASARHPALIPPQQNNSNERLNESKFTAYYAMSSQSQPSMSINLPNQEPSLRVIPMPADTNAHGVIFGGWVMAQVDLAGSVAAMTRAGKVVTIAVNSFTFKEPVYVGDLVSLYAQVTRVGRTSLGVDVQVYAERRYRDIHEIVKVTEATLTYVAIDDERKPRAIDPID
jgi:acyl-CoA thioesterase YciA